MVVIINRLVFASILAISGANAADSQDPYDLSFYTKGAAIGDS